MKKILAPLFLFLIQFPAISQQPCVNGLVNGLYPCNQVTLMAHLSNAELHGEYANDLWGWTDPQTNQEYALVGLTDGVTFVDVTNPKSPIVVGKLLEPPSSSQRLLGIQHGKSAWRDLKVYKDHVFIVSDNNAQHGMQVFDLTRLRGLDGTLFKEFIEDAWYDAFGSAHNIVINEATGYAYIVGIRDNSLACGKGGLYILNIQDPKNPVFEACFDEDGYTHDAQCVIYKGTDTRYVGTEICFNSNEDTFTIVDVESKSDMKMISRSTYNQSQYTHQGWLTEDHKYFLQNDELDEAEYGFNPKTFIWKLDDLENPELIGSYINEARAIDHNLYTHQGLVYESNYTSGLRIMDLERVENGLLREIAFFDTYPAANVVDFHGSWSNYPYFSSGNLIVSDIDNGLFIVRLALEDDPILTHPENETVCESQTINFSVEVEGTGFTFQWQAHNTKNYYNLTDNTTYAGVETKQLGIKTSASGENALYRCRVEDSAGNVYYSYPAHYELSDKLATASFSYSDVYGFVTFLNQSQNAESYLWDFGDGTTSEEKHPTHQFASGTYEVSLTASNVCGDIEYSIQNFVITSTKPVSDLKLYPNPARESITFESAVTGVMILYNISGERVLSSQVTTGKNLIDISQLEKGIYFLNMSNQRLHSIKLIVD